MKYGQMYVGAGLTLIGVCFGFAIATNSDAVAEAKWWDLMTAFGTVGAVIVALAVPVSERLARERTARKHRIVQDWANARDVTLCIGELKAMCQPSGLPAMMRPVPIENLEMARIKLDSTASRNLDPIGAAVIARCLEEVAVVRRYFDMAKNLMQRDTAFFHLSKRTRQVVELETLVNTWMDQILARATKDEVSLERR
ncbi:hypothetical protein ACFY89_29025 [Achromobacter spanius]|uniref:hypothetical protein n=1 Tax=Achromobacter spanius TaxID=217203 RepID=UPI0036E3474A